MILMSREEPLPNKNSLVPNHGSAAQLRRCSAEPHLRRALKPRLPYLLVRAFHCGCT
jgi:hypothetical protein